MHLPDSASNRPDAAVPTGKTYKWAIVGMLWFICFFNYADRQAISAITVPLQEEFGFNDTETGLIGSIFAFTYGGLAPFAGGVGDRFRRKTIILAGLYVWSAITGFTAICGRLWQFLLVRATEGVGETFYFPASMSMISDYHDRTTRSRAMGLHQTSVYAGTIGGAWFAGWMTQHYGWRLPFVILGVVGIVLGVFLAIFIREPQKDMAERSLIGPESSLPAIPQKTNYWEFLKVIGRTPTALLLMLTFVAANFVANAVMVWMVKYLNKDFGQDLAKAAFIGTFFIHMSSVLGSSVGGYIADRLRLRIPGGRIIVEIIGAALGAPFIYWCGKANSLESLIVAMSCFGFFKGVYDANIWAALFDVIPLERRASAVGLMNMCGWAGGAFWGPLYIGYAVDSGYRRGDAIATMSVLYVGIALLLVVAAFKFAPRDVGRQATI